MGLIASAVAALDAHPGIAEVAKCGLGFLQHQVAVPENQVTWVAVVLNIGRCVCVGESVLVTVAPCVAVVHHVQVALMSAVASAVAALDASLGDAEVAASGLGFLLGLAMSAENGVSDGVLLPWECQ